MIVFDFEVFRYDWLVVFRDLINDKYTTIINNQEELKAYFEENKNNLFIGYNNSRYDNYILKTILRGDDPYHISDVIVNTKNNINMYGNWNEIDLYSYDVSFGLGYTSLKENEAYLGISIDETPISFDLDRPLTDTEIEQVVEYCKRDVDATTILFSKTQSKFETKLYLCNEFGLDKSYLNKSDQSIITQILGAKRKYYATDHNDPFDFSQLDLKIKKYQEVIDYFSRPIDEQDGLALEICGVKHYFGIGGLHGAISKFSYEGKLMNIDVASYYPSMMIAYDWFARSIPDDKKKLYSKMKADRIVLKHTDKKLSDAYKLVLNTTYGCYKYKYCNLLDPKQANNICIGGQVMLVDLLEQLEPYCKLVQSNTDGIIIIPYDEDKIKELVADWEHRTKMEMEITYGNKIVQKDVNNYILATDYGIKAVGGYVRQYNSKGLRKTMAIVDKALVEHLINGVSIEDYIFNHDDISDFQIVSKVGRTYKRVFLKTENEEIPLNFVNRTFAGYSKGELLKQKVGKNAERVASQPSNCFVWDDDLSKLDINKINRQWYVDMTHNRLKGMI